MYYELYIDVFFLVNFMMDYLLLCILKKLLKCSATHGSICIGAIVGALCTCVIMVIPGLNAFVKFILFHGVVNILMIKTGLKIGWNKTFLKAYIFLYIGAFILGGIMEYLHQYIRTGSLFFALAAAGYFVSLGIWNLITCLAERNVRRCRVRLMKDGKECTVEALIDTGNRLRDSVTGRPVSIISTDVSEKLGIHISPEEKNCGQDIRYIPYHSIGKAEGILPIVTLDRMYIYGKEKALIEKPVIAICEEDISADDYEMIMNPDL